MHKFLLTTIIVPVAWFATGQTTNTLPSATPSGRSGATTTKPAATPRTEPTKSTYNPNAAAAPRLTPKSGTMRTDAAATVNSAQPTTNTPRTTAKSGTARPESSVERSTSTNTTARSARPARTTTAKKNTTSRYNGSGTARTVVTPPKKVVPVKPVEPVKINWITLEEALEKSKTDKRKIFVDVMTDWCGWCKRMDETTFTDPTVAQYLNEHFYAVKFNAEQTNDIMFQNKTYRFKSSNGRGYHELAAEWLNNRLSFPTSVFLDENMNLIQPLPGYQDASKLQAILNYFGTDSHRTTPWETYEKNFVNQR